MPKIKTKVEQKKDLKRLLPEKSLCFQVARGTIYQKDLEK